MVRATMLPSARRGRCVRAGLAAICLAMAGTTVGVAPVEAQTAGVDLETSVSGVGGGGDAVGAPTSVWLSMYNRGTQTATNLSLVVTLPDGAHFLGALHDNCTASAGTVTCGIDELPPLGRVSISIDLRFDEVGTFVLASSATADQPDADGDSGSELEVVVSEEEADLVAVVGSERVLPGASHRVRHIFWNRGPTNAGQVSFTGTFPVGAQVDPDSLFFGHGPIDRADDLCTTTVTGFACGPLPGFGATGISTELSYDIVAPDVPGPIESTVTVTGRNDPDATNNTGTLNLEVGPPVAELRLVLLGGSEAVPAGQPFDVTMQTWNHGDGAADEVVATVEVPEGWTVALPPAPDRGRSCEGDADDRVVHCTYDSVAPDTRHELVVPVTPPADGTGTGTINATVETASPEQGTFPNTTSREVSFAPTGVDMVAESSSHDPEVPRSGVPSTVTWQFRNTTPERLVTDLRFSVALPPGVRATRLQMGIPGGSLFFCQPPDPLDRNPSCATSHYVATTSHHVDEVELTLWVEYDRGGTFPFTATATQASEEQAPGDESLTHTVEVEQATADLHLSARPSAAEATVGDTYSYVASVRNDGPHDATDIVVADDLPAGTELVSAIRGWFGKPCDVDGNRYECGMRPLAPNSWNFVVVTVRATEAGPLASAPTVTAAQHDPDPASNTAPVTVEAVEPGEESPVDLVLTRHGDDDPLVAGVATSDVYVIENRSPRAATGVTLQIDDGEATNLEVVGAAFGWFGRSCATTATTTCTIPTIPAGGTQFVVVETRPRQEGAVDTIASVAADQPDADPSTDTVTITGDAAPPPGEPQT